MDDKEPLYKKIWRPLCAFVYLSICLFDFIIFPVYLETQKDWVGLEEKAQIAMIEKQYNPLTLRSGGMIHLAFGSLLTGAAVTRGLKKKDG